MQFVTVFAHSFRKMIENVVSKGAKSDVIVQPTITPLLAPFDTIFSFIFLKLCAKTNKNCLPKWPPK